MSDQPTPQQATQAAPMPGAWQDLMDRLKRGEREMVLAAVACALAILQFLIGATGGTLLTSAMLLNLALIGWLGNTAHLRRKRGEGAGLFALTGAAFVLATLSTLHLVEGITSIVGVAQTLDTLNL